MTCNILLSMFFSNSVAESDSNYPDVSVCVQERLCHLILGDWETLSSKRPHMTELCGRCSHNPKMFRLNILD